MKTIRCFLATVALLTLGGLSLFQGTASLATTISSHYASAHSTSSAAGKSFAIKMRPPCGGVNDC